MNQMSIFDFMQPQTDDRSLYEIPEVEMVQMIHSATGINFKYRDELHKYEAKQGKNTFNVGYSNYDGSVKGGARHISCSWGNNTEGCGSPCDTVGEAIDFFKKVLDK